MSKKAKATHTPGPWEWEYHPDNFKPCVLVLNGPDIDVLVATSDGGRAWVEVSEADAALIEAAPDLLAALQEALGSFRMTQNPEGYPRDHWCNQATAAIAKATAG